MGTSPKNPAMDADQIFDLVSPNGLLSIADFAVAFTCAFGYTPSDELYLHFKGKTMTRAEWLRFHKSRKPINEDERDLFLALDVAGRGYLSFNDIEIGLKRFLPKLDTVAFRIALSNSMGSLTRITYSHFHYILRQTKPASDNNSSIFSQKAL